MSKKLINPSTPESRQEEFNKLVVVEGLDKDEALQKLHEKYPHLKMTTLDRDTRHRGGKGLPLKQTINVQKLVETAKFHKAQSQKLLRKIAQTETFVEEVVSYIQPIELIEFPEIDIDENKKNMNMTFMNSDIHFNRVVDEEEMEGYGYYNFDVACANLYSCVKDIVAQADFFSLNYNINELHIDALGDMINDEHREENKWTNQFVNSEATVYASGVYAQMLIMLATKFPKIVVNCICGNEARIPLKMTSKHYYHGYDYIMYEMTKAYLKDYIKQGKIDFRIFKSPTAIVEKMGWKALLMHGNSVKMWGTGTPVYGMLRMKYKEQDLRRNSGGFDFIESRHFHTAYEIENESIYINGALCGLDQYVKNELHSSATPSQRLLFITEDRGVEFSRSIKGLGETEEHPFVYGDTNAAIARINA
jgi:hypothetical protein